MLRQINSHWKLDCTVTGVGFKEKSSSGFVCKAVGDGDHIFLVTGLEVEKEGVTVTAEVLNIFKESFESQAQLAWQ